MRIEKHALKNCPHDCLGLLLLLALCLLAPALPCAAQPPPQKENRFLFIINTSSDMRRDTNAIQQAVLGLLRSGMQGQMRDGDTFGIWNYDDQLHTDFPMQIWSKQNQDQITGAVTGFLAGRHYQKSAHLEKVLPVLRQTIAASRVLTVIFIYDGTETMQGSGFDKEINALQKQFGKQMRSNHLPFITLVAVWDGKAIDFSVNTPAKISMLQTADLIKPPVTNPPPAVVVAVPPPVVVPKPAPPPRHFEIILTNPPEPTPAAVAEAVTPPPAPAKLNQAPPPVTIPTNSPSESTNSASMPLSQAEMAELKEVLRSPGNPTNQPLPASQSAIASNTRAASTTASVNATPPSDLPTADSTPPVQAVQPAVAPAPPIPQTALITPGPGDHLALLVIAFSLLTIAVVLVLLLLRRARPTTSLISQSLDNPR